MQRSHGLLHTHDQEPHVGDSRLPFNTTSIKNSPEITHNHIQAPFSDPEQNSYIHHHHQLLQQSDQIAEEDQSYSMDDFFEHVLSMPSWSEVGSMAAKNNWDINSLDPLDQTAPKLFKAALMPLLDHDPVEAAHLMTTQRAEHQAEGSEDLPTRDGLQFHSDIHTPPSSRILANQTGLEPENAVSGLLSLLRMPEDAITGSLSLQSNTFLSVGGSTVAVPMPGAGIRRRSMGSSESEGSARQQPSVDYLQSSLPIAHSRQQPYVGASLPLSLAQAKSETLINVPVAEALTNEALAFGKRYRSGEEQPPAHDHSSSATQEIQGAIFSPSYGGTKANQMQAARSLGQQSHKQSGQGIPVQAFGGQGTITHPQTVNAHTGASRPRVRARRGQATDPHSIAERLRRERIADRMKWLQELVPNANKTDKASMLDEIIDYVKFLQLQVKVLSMSRMGGAGVMSPFVSDLPSEAANAGSFECGNLSSSNGAASQDVLTEREVARLMEVDMGSAMQFLQSKGLCLMPIALATAISSKSVKSSLGVQADKNRTEPSIASMSASSGPGTSSAAASPGGSGQYGSGIKLKATGISKPKDFIENTDRSNDISQSSRSPKGVVAKNNEDVSRRIY